MKALEMVAPGTALREGLDNILHAHTGGLLVIGDHDELSFLFSGGIKLDIDYTPGMLYQVAKMDGGIVLNANATKIAMANVQLTPDPNATLGPKSEPPSIVPTSTPGSRPPPKPPKKPPAHGEKYEGAM